MERLPSGGIEGQIVKIEAKVARPQEVEPFGVCQSGSSAFMAKTTTWRPGVTSPRVLRGWLVAASSTMMMSGLVATTRSPTQTT